MATACKIGIVKENGKVEGIICWYDGYPDHAGSILKRHYNTAKKAGELIAGGQLYEIAETVAGCHYQSSDDRIPADDCRLTTYGSRTAFYRADEGAGYAYLFRNGSWEYIRYN